MIGVHTGRTAKRQGAPISARNTDSIKVEVTKLGNQLFAYLRHGEVKACRLGAIHLTLAVFPARPTAADIGPWRSPSLTVFGALGFCLFYAAAPVIGFAILVALFKMGVFAGVKILFYRGLILIALALGVTFGLLFFLARRGPLGGLRGRDAVSAAMLSFAFNLCFLVLFPVTIDRSISVFVLGEMAAHQDRAYTSDEMSRVFTDVYVGDYRQIDRRMQEQMQSGNIERVGTVYRLTPHGKAFIKASKALAWMFDSDTRLVSPGR